MNTKRGDEQALPDWLVVDIMCDGCAAEDIGAHYHFLNINDNVDLCVPCYEKLNPRGDRGTAAPQSIFKECSDIEWHTCDCCFRDINKTSGTTCWRLYELNICTECFSTVDYTRLFMKITVDAEGKGHTETPVVYNDREYMFRYGVTAKEGALVIPKQLTVHDEEETLNAMDALVRPPSYDFNGAEWRFISDMSEVPCYAAECALAVRCVAGNHQVASVVCDDHGRMAMNIVWETIEAFLHEEGAWRKMRKACPVQPEEEREEQKAEILSFLNKGSCEEGLMMAATDSFAVFVRLGRKLSMYYG